MDDTILSGDLRLSAHVAVPEPARAEPRASCSATASRTRRVARRPSARPIPTSPTTSPTRRAGRVLTFNFRGTGTSEGDFSAHGWLDDLRAAVRALHARPDVRGVWVAGFGHGGTFAVCDAADDHLVRGVATIAAPSTLRDWAQDPGRSARARAFDGHDPHRGLPGRRDRAGSATSGGSTRSRRRSASIAARCSCCTASTTSGAGRRRPRARRRRPAQLGAAAGAGCGPPPAPRPACDRHAARLARPPGAERRPTEVRRRLTQPSPAAAPRGGEDGVEGVVERVLRAPPGGARRACAGSPTSTGTSTGAHEVGRGDDAQRASGAADEALGAGRRRAPRDPSTRCRPRRRRRVRRAARTRARRRARR